MLVSVRHTVLFLWSGVLAGGAEEAKPRMSVACWFFGCRGVWALRMVGGSEVCAGALLEQLHIDLRCPGVWACCLAQKAKGPALRQGPCHELELLTFRSGRPTRSGSAGCSASRH